MSAAVRSTVEAVLGTDVDAADRDELEWVIRRLGEVRSWAAAVEVRCARRAKVLAEAGRCGRPESTLTDGGRRSGRDAAAATGREEVCSSMGSFEEALGAGRVSEGHLDALARATTRLDEQTRGDVVELEAELLAAAESERVETFERRVRDTVKRLEAERAASDADELDRQRAMSSIRRWTDKTTGMCHTHLELDPIRNSTLWSTLVAQVNRARQRDGNGEMPFAQLQIDTLLDTIVSGASGADGVAPSDGDRGPSHRVPEATMLIDHHTAVAGLHERSICELENGEPIPVSTARRMLCDCEILPAMLDGAGVTLEEGRSRRTATRDQRRALRAMHRTCAHPDCTIGFGDCRIHHIRWWWRDTGPTDLNNLIPLCERHHHLVHEGGWNLTMTPDRITTWTRPDGSIAHHGTSIDRAPRGVAPPGLRRSADASPNSASAGDPDSGP